MVTFQKARNEYNRKSIFEYIWYTLYIQHCLHFRTDETTHLYIIIYILWKPRVYESLAFPTKIFFQVPTSGQAMDWCQPWSASWIWIRSFVAWGRFKLGEDIGIPPVVFRGGCVCVWFDSILYILSCLNSFGDRQRMWRKSWWKERVYLLTTGWWDEILITTLHSYFVLLIQADSQGFNLPSGVWCQSLPESAVMYIQTYLYIVTSHGLISHILSDNFLCILPRI